MAVQERLERRVVTILFADVVGFTPLSERLDAEDVATVQRAYFDAVREIVGLYGGTLEKFIGDAVMAVFGAPRARDDDAERAVRAGFALTHAVESLGGRLGLEDDALRVRVGVNTGEVVHNPDAGSETALVTGDAVNVAARLQAAASPGAVLLGEETALAVADAVELAEPQLLELKGKAAGVRARVAVAVRAERSREHAMGALRAPIVGRDDVLRRLRAAADAGGRIVVVAPPGTGKSRVLTELTDELPHVARAWVRPDALAPFEPVAQIVLARGGSDAALAERLAGSGLARARAEVVAAELSALVESRPATEDDRDAVFDAWLDGLDALAPPGRDVWFVEDVHWATPDLLAFLDAAAARGRRLVVATARPSLLDRERAWCDAGDVFDLPRLAPASAAELVHRLVGDALPEQLVAEVARVSDGNPLFIEELLRTWVSVRVLEQRNGTWFLTRDAAAVALPLNVQAIYTAQLDDLRPAARTVVRRASVAGRRFAPAALPQLGVDAPGEALGDLTRRTLLRGPEPDPLFVERYLFRHALLRDAGYASLGRAERASLHLRLADWLPEAAGERWAEVAEVTARHLASALEQMPALAADVDGERREQIAFRAAEWFERAARVARGRAANETARTLVLRALELTADDAQHDRARRLELLGDATAPSTDLDEAVAAYAEAADLYRAAGDDGGAARATVGHGTALCQQLQFEPASALAEAELERTNAPPRQRALLLLLRARGETYMGRVTDATTDATETALDVARSIGDAELELNALQLQVMQRSDRGLADEATWAELEQLARRVGRWDVAASAIRARGTELELEDPAAALAEYARSDEIAAAHALTESLAWTNYARAETYFASGDWDEATAAGVRALDVAEPNAYHRAAVRTWFVLVPIASARRNEELLDRARRWWEAHKVGLPRSDYGLLMGTAMTLDLGADPPANPAELLPSFDLAHGGPSWLAAVERIVVELIARGDVDVASEAVLRMRASLEKSGGDALANGVHELLESRLALARADADAAASHNEAALDQFTLRLAWWRAKALRALAASTSDSSALVEAVGIEARLGIPT